MNFYNNIGEQIKFYREKMGLSRTELAKGICSVSYISRIENGTRIPNSMILRQLTNRLGLPSELILRSAESPTALYLFNIFSQGVVDIEYHRFEKLHKLISTIRVDDSTSGDDKQIITSLIIVCEHFMQKNSEETLQRIDNLIGSSYKFGEEPSNIEFILLLQKVLCLIDLNQLEEVRSILDILESNYERVVFYLTKLSVVRLFQVHAVYCYHIKQYEDAIFYVNKSMRLAKKHAFHVLLIDSYQIKSKLYTTIKEFENAKKCDEAITSLKELLLYETDIDFDNSICYFM